MPLTPSLAGLSEFYAATQLYLFREGRRDNAAMSAIAKGFTDEDLRAFSSLIGSLPKPAMRSAANASEKRPGASSGGDGSEAGRSLASKYRCDACHGSDFAGGDQVPALAWQREDYLRKTLLEYKKGTRPGYQMAMADALADVPEKDLPVLARYIAGLSATLRP